MKVQGLKAGIEHAWSGHLRHEEKIANFIAWKG